MHTSVGAFQSFVSPGTSFVISDQPGMLLHENIMILLGFPPCLGRIPRVSSSLLGTEAHWAVARIVERKVNDKRIFNWGFQMLYVNVSRTKS